MRACRDQGSQGTLGKRPVIMGMRCGCVCDGIACQQVPADTRTGTVLKVRNVNLKKPLIIVSLSKSFRGMVTSWCLWRWEGREKKMHWCLVDHSGDAEQSCWVSVLPCRSPYLCFFPPWPTMPHSLLSSVTSEIHFSSEETDRGAIRKVVAHVSWASTWNRSTCPDLEEDSACIWTE